ncbi:MAG: carboxypeptidase regulatory-like domain-containing protein [Planctomycetes bacterium]|nr:carboxypeptidase regulatory-like domain-containing protein [Planctomycetota bacterium]
MDSSGKARGTVLLGTTLVLAALAVWALHDAAGGLPPDPRAQGVAAAKTVAGTAVATNVLGRARTMARPGRSEPVPAPPRTAQRSPPWALRGRVVDAGGVPAPQARVWLLVHPGAEGAGHASETRCDPRGEFTVALAHAPHPAITVVAHQPGFAPAVVDHVLGRDPIPHELQLPPLVLAPAGAAAGTVTTAGGGLCTAATIRLRPVHGPLLRLPPELLAELIPARRAGPDGEFAWADLAAGAYLADATAQGHRRAITPRFAVRAGMTTRLAPLVMAAGRGLRGMVFDPDGRALGDVAVESVPAGARDPEARCVTRTDATGRFALELLDAGLHHVRVTAPGSPALVLRDVDPERTQDLDLRLARGASLHGRVLATAGATLPPGLSASLQPAADEAADEAHAARERARLAAAAAAAQQRDTDPSAVAHLLRELARHEEERRSNALDRAPFGSASAPPRTFMLRPGPEHAHAEFAFTGLDPGRYLLRVETAGAAPLGSAVVMVRAGTGPAWVELILEAR